MIIESYPIINDVSIVSVIGLDGIKRLVTWDVWENSNWHPHSESLKVKEMIKDGTWTELCRIGSDRVRARVCDGFCECLFEHISYAYGALCLEDESYAEMVLKAAAEAANASNYPYFKNWLNSAKASLRGYKRHQNRNGIKQAYSRIIRYFRLFNIVDIDLKLEPSEARIVPFKVTVANGYSFDFNVDSRALTQSEVELLATWLANPSTTEMADEKYRDVWSEVFDDLYYGIVHQICTNDGGSTYNSDFTKSLIDVILKNKICTEVEAASILKDAADTENELFHMGAVWAFCQHMQQFLNDYHPMVIERVDRY